MATSESIISTRPRLESSPIYQIGHRLIAGVPLVFFMPEGNEYPLPCLASKPCSLEIMLQRLVTRR